MTLGGWFEKLATSRKTFILRTVLAVFVTSLLTFGYSIYNERNWSKQLKRANADIDTLTTARHELEKKVLQLTQLVERLQDSQMRFNFLEDQYSQPRIIKGVEGEVITMNKAYFNEFMKPWGFRREDYRNDAQFWGPNIAKDFRALEDKAKQMGRPVTVYADVKPEFMGGQRLQRTVHVAPLYDKYGILIAFEVEVQKDYK